MAQVSTLVLIRHGERADDENVQHLWQKNRGSRPHDCPLTDLGRRQAVYVGRRLALEDLPCSVVYSSPMRRCLETAAEIAHQMSLPIVVNVSLGKSCSYFSRCAARRFTPSYATASEAEEIVRNIQPSVSLQGYFEDNDMDCVSTIERLLSNSVEEKAVKRSVTLIVGHCEAQREITWLSGMRRDIDTPYCGKATFHLEHRQGTNGFWGLVETPEEDMLRASRTLQLNI